jgi:hypothetical protein
MTVKTLVPELTALSNTIGQVYTFCTEEHIHMKIRQWISKQGFPMESLCDLLYQDTIEAFMTNRQRVEANDLMTESGTI